MEQKPPFPDLQPIAEPGELPVPTVVLVAVGPVAPPAPILAPTGVFSAGPIDQHLEPPASLGPTSDSSTSCQPPVLGATHSALLNVEVEDGQVSSEQRNRQVVADVFHQMHREALRIYTTVSVL